MNESFVDFVVAIVEDAGDSESGERLVDALVPLILAFNQHFVGEAVVKGAGHLNAELLSLCSLNPFTPDSAKSKIDKISKHFSIIPRMI